MTDIVERLRAIRDGEEIERLATEIEQLRDDTQMLWDAVAEKNAEIERLRGAIRKYLSHQVSHQEGYRMFQDALDRKDPAA